jgi:hypothetical protein
MTLTRVVKRWETLGPMEGPPAFWARSDVPQDANHRCRLVLSSACFASFIQSSARRNQNALSPCFKEQAATRFLGLLSEIVGVGHLRIVITTSAAWRVADQSECDDTKGKAPRVSALLAISYCRQKVKRSSIASRTSANLTSG